jgi:2-dehydro-3-deoxygalactonokinase
MNTSLIALDWGTSSLRAYRLGADGAVLDRIESPLGILKVPGGDFDAVFEATVGGWLEGVGDVPIITAGMIGSRQGWYEIPYVACPAGVAELATNLHVLRTARGRTVWFVPGVSRIDEDGVPDVERGEEAQVAGAFAEGDTSTNVLLVPGTHSKWMVAEDGRLTWFSTFMTGEVFAVLCQHSILGRLMEGDADDAEAFTRGLDYAARDEARCGGLLKRLFSARSLGLFDKVPGSGIRSYLSGLLIGSEIREARGCIEGDVGTVTIIGGSALAPVYGRAMRHAGFNCVEVGEEAMVRGLTRIATAAGLIGEKP